MINTGTPQVLPQRDAGTKYTQGIMTCTTTVPTRLCNSIGKSRLSLGCTDGCVVHLGKTSVTFMQKQINKSHFRSEPEGTQTLVQVCQEGREIEHHLATKVNESSAFAGLRTYQGLRIATQRVL